MTLHFTRATAGAALLPRGRAESVPFASERLPEILSQLSIPAVSPTADAMWSTLAECEAARLAGETTKHKHYCATSLESMVEFVASSLGTRDVHAVSTEVISTLTPTPRQAYRVEAVRPVAVPGGDMVACHGMPYAYAVFGLHGLKGAGGGRVPRGRGRARRGGGGIQEARRGARERGHLPLPASGRHDLVMETNLSTNEVEDDIAISDKDDFIIEEVQNESDDQEIEKFVSNEQSTEEAMLQEPKKGILFDSARGGAASAAAAAEDDAGEEGTAALLRRRLLVGEAAANLEEEVGALERALAVAVAERAAVEARRRDAEARADDAEARLLAAEEEKDARAEELVLAAAKRRQIRDLELQIQAVNNMTSKFRWY
uniref:BURP domain-containing protein n=1 Tax=Oryza rufipogon TaxID=4529 RepID=A0A0E0PJ03_ORYRU